MATQPLKSGLVQYYAANGHRMEYYEHPEKPGQPAQGHSYEAWCASSCEACMEGYDLPDW